MPVRVDMVLSNGPRPNRQAGLHLGSHAYFAWSEAAACDGSGPWAIEAANRASTIRVILQQRAQTQPSCRQALRERTEDGLLPRWGEAVLAGDERDAAVLLAQAQEAASRLALDGGDTMAQDEIELIRRAGSMVWRFCRNSASPGFSPSSRSGGSAWARRCSRPFPPLRSFPVFGFFFGRRARLPR